MNKTFQYIFDAIIMYQEELGHDFENMSEPEKMQVLRNFHTALSLEQAEMLNEVPWKPWRLYKDQHRGTKEDLVLEWVDCLFFLVAQAGCLGLSAQDVLSGFHKKLAKNKKRITTGVFKTQNAKKEKKK